MVSIKTAKIKVNVKHKKKQREFQQTKQQRIGDNEPTLVEYDQIFFGTPPQQFGHGRQNVFADTTSHLRGTQGQSQSRPL